MKFLVFLFVVLIALCFVVVWFGNFHSDLPADLLSRVRLEIRLPRVLAAVLTGALLATSGLLMQTLLHNPLASPYTLGTGAGASLGVMLMLVIGGSTYAGDSLALGSAAVGGAMVVSLPVLWVAMRRNVPPEAVLLTGITFSAAAAAVISGLNFISTQSTIFSFSRWLLGNLGDARQPDLWAMGVALVLLGGIAWVNRFRLNTILAGDELASARGVNVGSLRALLIGLVALAVGISVASCGPIGFVGLIVPHMCRSMVGGAHGRLIPATLLVGAILLVACDWASQVLVSGLVVPVGVTTSVLGTPAFLVLLVRRFRARRGS